MKTTVISLVIVLCFYSTFPQNKVVFKIENNKVQKALTTKSGNVHLKSASLEFVQTVRNCTQLYPSSQRPELLKYFSIETDSIDKMRDFLFQNEKIVAQVYESTEPVPLYIPNDYDISYFTGTDGCRDVGLTYLDLVNLPEAWNLTTGNPEVLIGIYDSYLYKEHEDLQGQVHKIYDKNKRSAYVSKKDHGTMVAGIIAAKGNNDIGIPGVAFNCRLLKSSGDKNDLLKMAKDGVRVLNISQNWGAFREDHQLLINELVEDYKITVVAAAGNDNSTKYIYPASYDNVISVTSVGHEFERGTVFQGQKICWKDCHKKYLTFSGSLASHTHNDKVDICAPGYNLITTCLEDTYVNNFGEPTGQKYTLESGTSFACALVSGVCGLMYSLNPDLTPQLLENILKETAFDLYKFPENEAYNGQLGAGRIDAAKAVQRAAELLTQKISKVDYDWGPSEPISIFPNPCTEHVNISGTNPGDVVVVYNSHGVLVRKYVASSRNERLQMSNNTPGIYFIKLLRNEAVIDSHKIVKM